MNRKDRGWAEYAYSYRSLWTLAREWRIAIVGVGKDQHGQYLKVVPVGKARS